MNKALKYILIMAVSVFLQSCIDLGIYISDFPLSSSDTEAVDIRLIGNWEKISEKNKGTGMDTLEFILFNENEYVVRSGEGMDHNLVRAFITKISGISFLNFQDLSETKRQYVFCKYRINDEKELTLNFIADTIFDSDKPETSKKLGKFLKKNLKNPELFNKEMSFTFKKVKIL
ncbi:MAG: hypothetical protein KAS21_07450 [Candidatus Aminicenantes bacterium]|nr:hypothetical protein [Candidatus Aminicenantes bacterium]MCK5004906.1 hypothetical protein [Candidatus Aminicenantes bacterium]